MKYPIYLTEDQVKQLEYEVISQEFSIWMTRKLLIWSEDVEYIEQIISKKNKIINLSRTISGGKIYPLISDDMGGYDQVEYDWHESHFHLICRDLSTIELIEFISHLINFGLFSIKKINSFLVKDNASFRYIMKGNSLSIEIFPSIDTELDEGVHHPNIRTLVNRMEKALRDKDFSNVLHASASVFETMAKDIVSKPSIQNKSLKSFFNKYRQESTLPNEILDFILKMYEKRNVEPLAGHGSLDKPQLSKEQALTLCEMTKAFVKIEYLLRED